MNIHEVQSLKRLTGPMTREDIRYEIENLELLIKAYQRESFRGKKVDKFGRDIKQVLVSKRATLEMLRKQLDTSHKDISHAR